MTGKEKLYFLLNRIDDIREITPEGQPLKIHATHDLNNKYRGDELGLLFTKLEKDEKVLRVLKTGNRIKEIRSRYGFDYDDGCYHIELLASFDKYFLKIQHEPEYYEFTGKKPAQKRTYETKGQNHFVSPSYSKTSYKIIFNGKEISIPSNSNQDSLCRVIFKDKDSLKKEWNWDEMLEEWGGSYDGKEAWRKVYNAAREINKKVAIETGVKSLLIVKKLTTTLNPNYLK